MTCAHGHTVASLESISLCACGHISEEFHGHILVFRDAEKGRDGGEMAGSSSGESHSLAPPLPLVSVNRCGTSYFKLTFRVADHSDSSDYRLRPEQLRQDGRADI